MKKALLLIMIILMLGLLSCDKDISNRLENDESRFELIMPEQIPDDFEIDFLFGYDASNQMGEIDTVNHLVMKDLVLDGVVSAEYDLSKEAKMLFYEKLKSIEIINYPKNFSPGNPGDVITIITPCNVYELKISYDDVHFALYWKDQNGSDKVDAVALRGVMNWMIDAVSSLEVYIDLGEPNGGYD